ncbi:MAG: hypothetical protein K2N87_06110 [Eubacterium sp.]|nr:hypothetical protein [Eubacterium sp.]
MIAEIRGKVKEEDELTGNFFGNLRYISFQKGMKKILRNGIRPIKLQRMIDSVNEQYWDDCLFLWERVKENDRFTELDARLDFQSVVVGIEVKYKSGLSSEDGEDWEDRSAEDSINQLSREARVLKAVGAGKKKLLLLLADEFVCADTIKGINVVDGVQLGYLSWQEVLIQLKELKELNRFEQLIVSDLIDLLEKKGFLRFSGFELQMPEVLDEDYWQFRIDEDSLTEDSFSFCFHEMVEEQYYEYR